MMTLKKASYALLLATATFAQVNAGIDFTNPQNIERAVAETPIFYREFYILKNMWNLWNKAKAEAFPYHNNILLEEFNAPEQLKYASLLGNYSFMQYLLFAVLDAAQSVGVQWAVEKGYQSDYNLWKTKVITQMPTWAQQFAYYIPEAVFKVAGMIVAERLTARAIFGAVDAPKTTGAGN